MFTVKSSKCLIFGSIFIGALGLGGAKAMASDGVLSKTPLTADNYCHLKFPAIRPRTLSTNHQQLKSPKTGDIVDFYGPCDHNPLGKSEVSSQREQDQLLRNQGYDS